jgi:hypothetical protein
LCWRACAPGRGVRRLPGSSALGGEGPGACTEARKPMSAPRQLGRTPAQGGSERGCRQCSPRRDRPRRQATPGADSVLRWILRPARIVTGMSTGMNAMRTGPRRVVHLELHTGDQVRAGAFYAELLQWRPELVRRGSSCYLAVDLGPAVGGGSSSARRGVRCGCRTPRSSGSAMRPSTPAGSARRCCSNHGRGRQAGEVSCPARSPGRWPCGSRSDDRRARSA